jgi:cell division protein FtsL
MASPPARAGGGEDLEGEAVARARPVPGTAPARRPAVAPRRPFRLLTAEDLAERSRRRRARVLVTLSAAILGGALLAVAGAQALVASQQVRIDSMQEQLATQVTADQDLQLDHAELSSPGRVLAVAEHELGMTVPATVTYLPAVDVSGAHPGAGGDGTRPGRPGAKAAARTGRPRSHAPSHAP